MFQSYKNIFISSAKIKMTNINIKEASFCGQIYQWWNEKFLTNPHGPIPYY